MPVMESGAMMSDASTPPPMPTSKMGGIEAKKKAERKEGQMKEAEIRSYFPDKLFGNQCYLQIIMEMPSLILSFLIHLQNGEYLVMQ